MRNELRGIEFFIIFAAFQKSAIIHLKTFRYETKNRYWKLENEQELR